MFRQAVGVTIYGASWLGFDSESFYINNAQSIIKPSVLVADPNVMKEYTEKFLESGMIDPVYVDTDTGQLSAHRLTVMGNERDLNDLPVDKTIIFLPGNGDYVAQTLPKMGVLLEHLVAASATNGINTNFTCFCQDYRGRGFNQKKDGKSDNFTDYTLLQDANDQAALIRRVVGGRANNAANILILGYSYGVAAGLAALDILMKENKALYGNLKFYADRGFGNPFNHPWVKPCIKDQKLAHKKLYEKGMMPESTLHDIALQTNSFIVSVKNDECIDESISLFTTFAADEIPERRWVGEAKDNKLQPHVEMHDALLTSGTPELTSQHFLLAMLHELPLKARVAGISPLLKEKTHIGVDLSELVAIRFELQDYRERHFTQAASTSRLKSTDKETDTKKANAAADIMKHLSHSGGLNFAAIKKLQDDKTGLHQSGNLKIIFDKLIASIEKYEQFETKMQPFNAWIASLKQQSYMSRNNHYSMYQPAPDTADDKLTGSTFNLQI